MTDQQLYLSIGIPALLTFRKVVKDETASKLGLSVLDKWLKRCEFIAYGAAQKYISRKCLTASEQL